VSKKTGSTSSRRKLLQQDYSGGSRNRQDVQNYFRATLVGQPNNFGLLDKIEARKRVKKPFPGALGHPYLPPALRRSFDFGFRLSHFGQIFKVRPEHILV
jgi:hypothetical protein